MFIRSERLFLRPAWPEDWQDLFGQIADQEIVRNLARAPWPYAPDDARAFVGQSRPRLLPGFLITRPGAGGAELIGGIGLSDDRGQVELGYWIARKQWGYGYATEAARAVLRLAEALGHRRIGAFHFADNPASGRVLAKAGFQPSGDNHPRFSLARGALAPAQGYVLELGEIAPMPIAA